MAKRSHNPNSSSRKVKKVQLQKRDLQILQHVGAFRLTTVETLKQLFFPQAREDALKSCVRRLRNGYLVAEPLDAKRSYYRLTRRSAKRLSLPREVTKPLGRQAKLERYALLWFFTQPEQADARLFNPHEVGMCEGHRLPRHNFFLTAKGVLGYVLVDHGTTPQRLLRKIAALLERFLRLHWFDAFIRLGNFRFVLLTPSERTKRLVESNLARRLGPQLRPLLIPFAAGRESADDIPFKIDVKFVPEMGALLFDDRAAIRKKERREG